jgi:hypothetical protein
LYEKVFDKEILADVLSGIIIVSILLGITLLKHFALYREQQRKLEEAREEALRLSEIKTNFLANMSHEIRISAMGRSQKWTCGVCGTGGRSPLERSATSLRQYRLWMTMWRFWKWRGKYWTPTTR